MTIYNPLLDCFAGDTAQAVERPWQVVSDMVFDRIERAVSKANNQEAFKWLNVMDLLCEETAAYWRNKLCLSKLSPVTSTTLTNLLLDA